MKLMLSVLTIVSMYSSTIFAFSSVSEILPSGKLLICKSADQVKVGENVENYRRTNPSSSSDYSTTKVSEFKLPSVGQKITLTHKDFHSRGRGSIYHTEEVGSAIVSGESLEGEDRTTYSLDNSKFSRRIEKKSKITKDEALEIQKNCLVAIPQNDLRLNERASVSW